MTKLSVSVLTGAFMLVSSTVWANGNPSGIVFIKAATSNTSMAPPPNNVEIRQIPDYQKVESIKKWIASNFRSDGPDRYRYTQSDTLANLQSIQIECSKQFARFDEFCAEAIQSHNQSIKVQIENDIALLTEQACLDYENDPTSYAKNSDALYLFLLKTMNDAGASFKDKLLNGKLDDNYSKCNANYESLKVNHRKVAEKLERYKQTRCDFKDKTAELESHLEAIRKQAGIVLSDTYELVNGVHIGIHEPFGTVRLSPDQAKESLSRINSSNSDSDCIDKVQLLEWDDGRMALGSTKNQSHRKVCEEVRNNGSFKRRKCLTNGSARNLSQLDQDGHINALPAPARRQDIAGYTNSINFQSSDGGGKVKVEQVQRHHVQFMGCSNIKRQVITEISVSEPSVRGGAAKRSVLTLNEKEGLSSIDQFLDYSSFEIQGFKLNTVQKAGTLPDDQKIACGKNLYEVLAEADMLQPQGFIWNSNAARSVQGSAAAGGTR